MHPDIQRVVSSKDIEKSLKKLKKNDHIFFKRIQSQIDKILREPHIGKPLRYTLRACCRMTILQIYLLKNKDIFGKKSQKVLFGNSPLTTSTKKNPYHRSAGIIEGKDAHVIISQIKLIDTKRLSNKLGKIEKGTFEEIKKAVKGLL